MIKERHTGSPEKRKVPLRERIAERKASLDNWARGDKKAERALNNAKSNVGEYRT